MKKFKIYLESLGQRINTARGYVSSVVLFVKWLENNTINPVTTSYTDLLAYVDELSAKGLKKHTINVKITGIKHYFNYLQDIGKMKSNPVGKLRLKNTVRRIPHDLLEYDVLEALYANFDTIGLVGKRNQIILGLLIYQGINASTLQKIEVADINLSKGEIRLPSTSQSNSRVLDLNPKQILVIHQYLLNVRPSLLEVKQQVTDKLLVSTGKRNNLHNVLPSIIKKLRKQHDEVKSLKQIRASVITYWFSKYGTREVQYMAGHKYASSTERYQVNHLKDLEELLDKFHPLI